MDPYYTAALWIADAAARIDCGLLAVRPTRQVVRAIALRQRAKRAAAKKRLHRFGVGTNL